MFMLKKQLQKLLQYTDYLKQIEIIKENIKYYKEKANFSWLEYNLFIYLHITNKVLKITIIN